MSKHYLLTVVMLHIKLKGMEHRAPCKHIFCLTRTLNPRWGQKVKHFFSERKMLHIKLKGIEHRAPCMHIFCPYTYTRPLRWGQNIFTESSQDA